MGIFTVDEILGLTEGGYGKKREHDTATPKTGQSGKNTVPIPPVKHAPAPVWASNIYIWGVGPYFFFVSLILDLTATYNIPGTRYMIRCLLNVSTSLGVCTLPFDEQISVENRPRVCANLACYTLRKPPPLSPRHVKHGSPQNLGVYAPLS